MKIYDTIIIGAGVVGCCLASDLSRSHHKVLVLDKANDVATGASKANSGLVHAGFDAKEGSLKAMLNVKGNRLYPAMCKRLGVPLEKTGAIVVGSDKSAVETLYRRGQANGVKNLFVLSRDELLKLAPNLSEEVTVGLYAKDAYVVSPYLLTICLCEEAIVNGADVRLNFNIAKIEKQGEVFAVTNGNETFFAKTIVNSAGAGVNDVAKLIGSETYEITYRRGEYYVLDSTESGTTKITVFPLPTKDGKGILVTPTIDKNILVGPTSYESDDSTITTVEGLASVKEKSQKLLTNVNLRRAIRQFAGVRSIVGDDFVIEKSKKVKGVITLAGICSPGLSSAPAISRYVISLLGLNFDDKDAKKITPYRLFKNLSTSEKNELVKKDKRYGKIVCKCENITEGDIVFALNRPLKVCSVDGIKRRVRAGMGRCQGGFCSLPVASLIAKYNKIPLESVLKENAKSNVFAGKIRGGSYEV